MKYRLPLSFRVLTILGFALIGLAAGSLASHDPNPEPVVNLNRQLISAGDIATLQPIDGRIVFIQRIELRIYELWVSDGTGAGTLRLRDLCPDPCAREPRLVASTGTEAFFLAPDDQGRTQLWITDGTLTGTRPLTQLENASFPPSSSLQGGFHWSGAFDKLFFSVRQVGVANQLWTSDGTPTGTQPLGDPSPFDAQFRFDDEGEVPGAVLFSTLDESGEEPWRTDGTIQGTRRLGDLAEGPSSSAPFLWTKLGDDAVFIASDDTNGRELWITDGTSAGTRLVRDLTPGPDGSGLEAAAGGAAQAFFFARTPEDELDLIRTDGTFAGTRRIGSFLRESAPAFRFGQSLGSLHVFAATTAESGRELWVTDGTAAGTLLLDDMCPGECSSNPQQLFRSGEELVFTVDDGLEGRELWTTDGTPGGTRQVADLCAGSCSSDPRILTQTSNGRLLVLADDGFAGREVWALTRAGAPSPQRLSDFTAPEPFSGVLGDSDGGALFTAAELDEGVSLWSSNGTPASTRALQKLAEVVEAGSRPHAFVPWQGDVLFTATTPERGNGLWRLENGSASFIAALETGSRNSFRETLDTARVGERLFLWTQSNGNRGDRGELWMTRGTPESTRRLQENVAPVGDGQSAQPVLNGKVFFHGVSDNQGLWATDGNTAARLYDGRFFSDNSVALLEGRLYFPGEISGDFGLERELWVTDGTPAGTRPFLNLAGDQPSDPRYLTVFDDHLYFSAAGQVRRTDGTVNGTTTVAAGQISGAVALEVVAGRLLAFGSDDMGGAIWAVDPGVTDQAKLVGRAVLPIGSGDQPAMATVGDVLFFFDQNQQIWRTDATSAGTFPVDLVSVEFMSPAILESLPGHLLISERGSIPDEPRAWISDGTPAGTRPLTPLLRIGPDVLVAGSRALVAGSDGRTGSEIWSLSLDDTTPPPPPPPPPGQPAAPRNLRAEGTGSGAVLRWQDVSSNETAFEIQIRRAVDSTAFETVAFAPAGVESLAVNGLSSGQPHHFRVRAVNGQVASEWSSDAVATPVLVRHDCLPGSSHPQTLCLQDGRFEVRVLWRDPRSGDHGDAGSSAFDFSDDSGTFWFFDPANVELVVKVLDARPVNGFQWVFYGALSDVEYWITVTDTQTETNVTYYNPPQEICGLGDVRAFPRPQTPGANLADELVSTSPKLEQGAGGTACTPGAENLCLSRERYRVEVEWRDPRSGDEGRGMAIPGTADSGYFWFFDQANVELVVKVLDARTVNGHVWVFFGALTDVEYTVTVTDTESGLAKTSRNEPGNICGQADVRAF